jgi:hypothetical protein
MNSIQWTHITEELANAKIRRILDVISRAEQRIKLQRVSRDTLAEQQLHRKALDTTVSKKGMAG